MIVIVGPTASGKTDLAVALARAVSGEVVSADSRQVYRELAAGTAKPLRDCEGRVAGVPYHLVDCASLAEPYDAGRYAAAARAAVADIQARGRTPIVAGGTGLYVRALLDGLSPLPRRDEALRGRLEAEARELGRDRLHQRLARVDPQAAAAIPANNIQRVVRALEVFELTGRPISAHWEDHKKRFGPDRDRTPTSPPGGDVVPLGGQLVPSLVLRIDWAPETLRRRIEDRAGRMWPGMLAEVRTLLRRFTGAEPGFQSLGYPQALACVRGELSPEAGLQSLVRSTCALARRQRTWFRHQIRAASIVGGAAEDMLREALVDHHLADHYATTTH